jgi:MFS family permease
LINVPIGIVGVLLALRVVPETRDTEAHTNVDWWGMTTIGASVFCLTYGLVEANNKGWGSPEIVTLFVASVVLAVAFGFSQRRGRFPMLTERLVRNRQFVGASISLMLFAIGMMGTLFVTVIAFVNLWHYSELEAALAISPVAIMGLLVAPLIGRLSTRARPRVVGVPALVVMAAGLYWLSTFPAKPSYWSVLPGLVLMGIGVGATFPAVSIGSMGTIRGQELGLGSGIVNMSRQVGFAIGVALLVAVFTGSLDNQLAHARHEVASVGCKKDSPCFNATFVQRNDPSRSPVPKTPLARRARGIVAEHVRNSYAAALRVAALVTLLGIPFSLTMRRRPGEDQAGAEAAAGS